MADQVTDFSSDIVSMQKQLLDAQLKSAATGKEVSDILLTHRDITKKIIDETKHLANEEKALLHNADLFQLKLAEAAALQELVNAGKLDQKDIETQYKNAIQEANNLIAQRQGLESSIKKQSHDHLSDIIGQIPLIGKLLSFTKQLVTYWQAHKLLAVAHLSIIGILYTTSQIVARFFELDKAATAFRKQMGLHYTDSVSIEKSARQIATDYQAMGVTAENVYNSIRSVAESVGSTQFATEGMVTQFSLMQAQLGISEKTSAEFAKTMGMVSSSTMEGQRHMLGITAALTAASGVKLDDVMNDVASASKSSYQFLSKDPLVLAKAAVEARRMGTSLEQSVSSARSLIDFTTSVKSEMAASVLLGKSLNLQKARELAYHKNIEGLNREILRLAKDVNFEQLDPFQQEEVARAFGKQAGEVSAMLQSDRERKRLLGAMNGPLRDQVMAYEELRKSNLEAAKKSGESLENLLKTKSNQESLKTLTDAWRSIFQSLAQDILPPVVKAFRTIAGWLNSASSTMKKLVMGAVLLGSVLTGVVLIAFSKIGNILANKVLGGAGKGAHGLFSGIGRGLASIGRAFGNAMKGVLVIAALGVSLIPFAKAWQMLEGLDPMTLLYAATALTALGTAAFFMAPALPVFAAGALAIAALGASLIPFGIAAEKAGKGMQLLGEGFNGVVSGFERLAKLSLIRTTLQVISLTGAIVAMSEAISNLPKLELETLEKVGQINLFPKAKERTTPELANDVTNQALLREIMGLRADLNSGKIAVHVYLDPQKSAVASGRYLELTGNEKPGKT